jgi:hypothetical protein
VLISWVMVWLTGVTEKAHGSTFAVWTFLVARFDVESDVRERSASSPDIPIHFAEHGRIVSRGVSRNASTVCANLAYA